MATEYVESFETMPAAAPATDAALELVARRALDVLAATPKEGDFVANGVWGVDLARLLDGRGQDDIFIADLRSRKDYEAGHIAGAAHIPFDSWADDASLSLLPEDGKIVLVCEFGNLAPQAAAVLRLLGRDAAILRTGMNGWAPNPGREQVLAAIGAAAYPVIQTPPEPAPEAPDSVFDKPSESEYKAVLARARAAIESMPRSGDYGNNIIQPSRLHEKLQDQEAGELFLLDLRREEDFEGVGHIDGAIRMDFEALLMPENLGLLPAKRKIITICYTGNLAAQAASVLRLLGYDAAVLAYGMVGWKLAPTTYFYRKDLKSDNPLVS